jgi:multiple sugar transport system substrate-binding protein
MNMARGSAAGQQYYEWIYSAGAQPWESNYPGSPDAYADQRGLYNSPESVAFIEWMQEMVNYMPPGVEQYAWDERAKAFTQGKVAMINNWSVRTPLFNDPEISKVKGKFGVALFPHAAGAESVPPVGGWIACVNKHSKNQEAAWDYLKWFASPEIHREWVLMGAPPSRHSAMNDPQINAEQPWTPVLYESSLRAWQELRPRHALTFELIETLGIEVNKALTGESSAQEAMDTANKKIDRLLKSEGYID